MRFLAQSMQRIPVGARGVLQTVFFGLAGGLVAVAFQKSIGLLYFGFWPRLAALPPWQFLGAGLALITMTSLASGWLLARFCPEASGSGIPQLKIAYWKDFGDVPWRSVWVKFLAGVLSIGGGSSLGREGPTVQMGGGLASATASVMGVAKQDRRAAAACGAASGLAAAFNSPIAAVTFVLEEIIEDLNSRHIGKVLLASVIGAAVLYFLVGKDPAFEVPDVDDFGWKLYFIGPVIAAVAGLVGVFFQRLSLDWRKRIREKSRLTPWLRPAVGGLITWAIGSALFLEIKRLGIFGLGYDDLTAALNGHLLWYICLLLLIGKCAATAASYAWGGCGGIFAPCLFLGGMAGAVVAAAIGLLTPITPPERMVLAVVGMSACLGAVVRAPVTSILIVFEMTHEFTLVPLLMLGAIASQAVSRIFCRHNFYAEVLEMEGQHIERHRSPPSFAWWFKQPVASIMNEKPVLATDLSVDGLRRLMQESPHERFPARDAEGRLLGVLTRAEAKRSLENGQPPTLHKAMTCPVERSINEIQLLLAESEDQLAVLTDAEGHIVGMLTLHDLLRAQLTAQDRGE